MIGNLIGLALGISANVLTLIILNENIFTTSFEIYGGTQGYILCAIVFGVLNSFVRPLLKIVMFPLYLVTLGLSSFFINGLLLWVWEVLVNFLAIENISVSINYWTHYIVIGFILSVANTFFHWFTVGK